jgi:hypothetical protein
MEERVMSHKVCKMYSVWQVRQDNGFVWAEAKKVANRFGGPTIISFAVRLLGLDEDGLAVGVGGRGEIHRIPLESLGEQIPDVEFLPGREILIDGRAYVVNKASDEPFRTDAGIVTESFSVGKRDTFLGKHEEGHWVFGSTLKNVVVREMS